jgi:hypothetical protein
MSQVSSRWDHPYGGTCHLIHAQLPAITVTMCTYHAWFAEPLDFERGSPWRPAPQLRSTNIPYSQLIRSLIKLRTNSHHLDIERLRHVTPRARVPRSCRACPWCHTPGALHDELHCTLECPHLSNTRLRYPALFGAGQACRQTCALCSPLSTWLLLWLRLFTAFLL